MKRVLVFLAALLLGVPAYGQVRQSGNVTPTHVSCWTSSGVVQDCGASTSPYATTFGVLNGTGVDGLCVQSDKPPAAGYQRACLGATTTGGAVLSVQNFGTAPAGRFLFNINGSNQAIPTITLPVINGDAACFSGTNGTLIDCGVPPGGVGLAHTHIFVGNASNDTADFGALATFSDTGSFSINPSSGNAVTINPAANSTGHSITSTQTSPTSGSIAGPFNWNTFSVTNNNFFATGAGSPDNYLNTNIAGVKLDYFLGGTNASTSTNFGIVSHMHVTLSDITSGNGDKSTLVGTNYQSVNDSSSGWLTGVTAASMLGVGTRANGGVQGSEIDSGILTGASAKWRFGLHVGNTGDITGTTLDTAFAIGNYGTAGGAFLNLFLLTDRDGTKPLADTATMFSSDTAHTIAHVFSMSNMTVTGNILNFPNAQLSGAGILNLGLTTSFLSINNDTFIGRTAAAQVRIGGAASATPISQALNVQNVVGGTSDTNGVDFTIRGSLSTGSGVGGSISFQTSPAGVSSSSQNTFATAMTIFGTGSVGIGSVATTPAAGVRLAVNKNTVAAPLVFSANTVTASIVGADSVINRLMLIGTQIPLINFVRSGVAGSLASPTATQSGDIIGGFGATGYGATGYGINGAAGIQFIATETESDTAQGNKLIFLTTPNTTATAATAVTVQNSGGLSVGSATDGGIGVVLALNGFQSVTAAKTLILKQGANGSVGTFVCTGGGTITISNSNFATTDAVIISMNTAGGTITTPPAFKTVSGGSQFQVLCGATDTSTYNYALIKNAA